MFRIKIFLKETSTTMAFAKDASKFVLCPFIIVSEMQTAGHGQYGRKWFSPPGGLWFTEVFYLKEKTAFSLFLSIPILRVLKKIGVGNAYVKWPNDIYIGSKKLGGILVKVRGNVVFAGIGINVENEVPFGLTDIAVSLKDYVKINRIDLLDMILYEQKTLLEIYKNRGFSPFVSEYNNNLIFAGKSVTVRTQRDIDGVVKGVNSKGALIVEDNEKVILIKSGTIIEF